MITGNISVQKCVPIRWNNFWAPPSFCTIQLSDGRLWRLTHHFSSFFRNNGRFELTDEAGSLRQSWPVDNRRARLSVKLSEGLTAELKTLNWNLKTDTKDIPLFFNIVQKSRNFSFGDYHYTHKDFSDFCTFRSPSASVEAAILIGHMLFNPLPQKKFRRLNY